MAAAGSTGQSLRVDVRVDVRVAELRDALSSAGPEQGGALQAAQAAPGAALPPDIGGFESLDKWKGCLVAGAPECFVYKRNYARASHSGFPSRLEVGRSLGLTGHEVAAIFGWTTGDYRLINPIARGMDEVEFEDYPFMSNMDTTKALCRLSRSDVLPYVQVLSSALSKLPALVGRTVLWRGHRRPLAYQLGSTVVFGGFTSASRDRDDALAFAKKPNEGRSAQRTLVAFVEYFSARSIAKLSARQEELEAIFPLDTAFEVVAGPEDDPGDRAAVRAAGEELRREVPGAEIELLYVREVRPPGAAA